MGLFSNRRIDGFNSPNLPTVGKKLAAGEVIPFVGAGVSANTLNGSTDYAEVLGLAFREIEELQNILNSGSEAVFLAAFRAQYFGERANNDFEPRRIDEDREDDDRPKPIWQSSGIREFRVAFARLIIHLTECHKSGVATSEKFYFSPRVSVQCTNLNPTHVRSARTALQRLIKSSDWVRLPGVDESPSSSESAGLISGRQFMERVEYALSDRYNGKGTKLSGEIDADHIVWLTDILWLTIAVWLPLYPTSRELSTEMSVISDLFTKAADRRLLRAAECYSDPEDLAKHIRRRFGMFRGEAEHSAAVVMDSHAALSSAAVHAAIKAQDSRQPIVMYTTNFDRGLELALERIIRGYYAAGGKQRIEHLGYRTIYPVLVRDRDQDNGEKHWSGLQAVSGDQADGTRQSEAGKGFDDADAQYQLMWVARDWYPDRTVSSWILKKETSGISEQDRRDANDKRLSGGLISSGDALRMSTMAKSVLPDIRGPVVVKLHGAPLEQLDQLELLAPRTQADLRHYLVLSEFQYIDTIIQSADTTPAWLTDPLKEQDITFLGYSIEDWNIRLHLARQPTPREGVSMSATGKNAGSSANNRGSYSRSAIVRRPTTAEQGLFQRLGIGLANRELGFLVRLIIEDPQVKRTFSYAGDRKTAYLSDHFPDKALSEGGH